MTGVKVDLRDFELSPFAAARFMESVLADVRNPCREKVVGPMGREFFPYLMVAAGAVAAIMLLHTTSKALLTGFRTSRLPWRGGKLDRREQPIGFWMMVLVYLFVSAVGIILLLAAGGLVLDRMGWLGAPR